MSTNRCQACNQPLPEPPQKPTRGADMFASSMIGAVVIGTLTPAPYQLVGVLAGLGLGLGLEWIRGRR